MRLGEFTMTSPSTFARKTWTSTSGSSSSTEPFVPVKLIETDKIDECDVGAHFFANVPDRGV